MKLIINEYLYELKKKYIVDRCFGEVPDPMYLPPLAMSLRHFAVKKK